MTRLRTEDIKHITQELEAYDQQLLNSTGRTLKGIACHAHDLREHEFEAMVKSVKVCVIPLTCGQGVIHRFSETVSDIVSFLGFSSRVAQRSDACGITEAFENDSDILVFADENRFVAINVHTKYVSDNIKMTARGFVAGLDLMAKGLKGKNVLVIGCGEVGCCTARILVAMGVQVTVCDINAQLTATLQKEISDELKAIIQTDTNWHSTSGKYQCIIDATPSVGLIDASMITPDTYVAVPGVPCGLSSEARNILSHRVLHDPLQIGVATMVIDACNQQPA